MSIQPLDTSSLGPIRIEAPHPISVQARELLARGVERNGTAWRNAADSIRSGAYGNIWTESALWAIEEGLRSGFDE